MSTTKRLGGEGSVWGGGEGGVGMREGERRTEGEERRERNGGRGTEEEGRRRRGEGINLSKQS